MKQFRTLFCVMLVVALLFSAACTAEKNGTKTENPKEWAGDNMENFTAEGLNISL